MAKWFQSLLDFIDPAAPADLRAALAWTENELHDCRNDLAREREAREGTEEWHRMVIDELANADVRILELESEVARLEFEAG